MPIVKNDERMYVYLEGSHFQQNNVLTLNNDHVINNNVINIYIVYKLDPIASIRDTNFTIQNALFGAMQITKNADTSKYYYKGYGICFDESVVVVALMKLLIMIVKMIVTVIIMLKLKVKKKLKILNCLDNHLNHL